MMGVALFVVAVLIIAIWVIIELQRMKHKVFAVFLIILILFLYISAIVVFKEKDIDYKSISGVVSAFQVYFSWMWHVFANVKGITTNAVQMDWVGNQTGG